MPGVRAPLQARFWSKVNLGAGCWEWKGPRAKTGYGTINVNGMTATAHRVAWILVNGTIPPGLHVLHRCDNPPCVRPDHLFLGTHDDNMRDCSSKGRCGSTIHPERRPRGERHPGTRLTAELVRQIRALRVEGATCAALARRFGVSRGTIHNVVARRTWRHVP